MREIANVELIRRFMVELGNSSSKESTVYLTGGSTAVLCGWRETTVDADIKIHPENDELLRALGEIKEKLRINVELASPDLFIPPLPNWQDRSEFIVKEGAVTFRHYDFYAQALSKISRGQNHDIADATQMLERGLINKDRLLELFEEIEPSLYRYPAIDPPTFRRSVKEFAS